jgi:branched-subunit amino acid aminotransferase/4-amino-4-deoxychorismate lyase
MRLVETLLEELRELSEKGTSFASTEFPVNTDLAAVISPVGKIRVGDHWYRFHGDGESIGPTTQALYDHLTAIQR